VGNRRNPQSTQEVVSYYAFHGLRLLLDALDQRLLSAIQTSRSSSGAEDPMGAFRGLYTTRSDAENALERRPMPSASEPRSGGFFTPPCGSHLGEFQNSYSLEPFDWGILAIALAPEFSLRYERVYGFLQDDVNRRRPSVSLILDLLCTSEEEKFLARGNLSGEGSLLRHRIIRVQSDPNYHRASFLSQTVGIEEWALRTLLQDKELDKRLTGFCRLTELNEAPDKTFQVDPTAGTVASLLLSAITEQKPLLIFLRGKSALQARQVGEAAAASCCQRLLLADFSRATHSEYEMDHRIEQVLREAALQSAVPFFEGISDEQKLSVARITGTACGAAILAAERDSVFAGTESCTTVMVDLPALGLHERRALWLALLANNGATVDDKTVEALASRFKFTPEQIMQAVNEGLARLNDGTDCCAKQLDALFMAARAQCGHSIAKLARKLNPKNAWKDLALPEDVICQLREFCARLKLNEHIFSNWGFEKKLSHGKGTTALFVGPPGTGKTMAAEVIANEIKLDIYKIDLAGIVSKYIGETQKNLDRIFSAAEDANGVLFFDEADMLFGKRSEVRDSHDRYANSEVSYLLQKMEMYEGAVILATNLSQHMDEAFLRRFAFAIRFPFPEEDCRRQIWKSIWPEEVPLDDEINFDHLASRFRLSGGNIKNVALAAAFFAAEEGGTVTMAHLFRGIEREYQKMGKNISAAALHSELERALPQ